MIDIHCHLLPGIDDGPDTLAQALDLCRLAVANGITHAVVTPHIHPGRYENEASNIAEGLAALRLALQEASIPLQLGMAAEVRVSPEIMPLILQNRVPFHGEWKGKRVMLMEFPHSQIPAGSDRLVAWLLKQNVLPLIAHPERNKDVMRQFSKLHPFIEMGCLFQVTAGALAGRFGDMAEQRAREIIEGGWATVLASDAHNVGARPPELREGVAAAARLIGEPAALALVTERPWSLVASQFAVAAP